ncbi:hypothetical protein NW754_009839 [Fusarium falciforme]|uniref:Uncharacterized protein n=1 Tax=Fusarium falciforme TaxID=195108 RepID=A0A9W8R252_9HYPO|nr:hypothetical protein NW754_009839 [Fusarium falciforme]KAJ4185506.1 hypothetical protein NW755_008499 [Fusarium falciforme]KAJ4204749.1 hypothetical protein NW767_004261 [Fusarium falciforme]KAJ4243252.1 hypothetical protein NW757_011361 [Fusarium falciforme]
MVLSCSSRLLISSAYRHQDFTRTPYSLPRDRIIDDLALERLPRLEVHPDTWRSPPWAGQSPPSLAFYRERGVRPFSCATCELSAFSRAMSSWLSLDALSRAISAAAS